MPDFTFELEHFDNQAQEGLRGTAGPYGEVMVYHVKELILGTGSPTAPLRTELVSEHLPEAELYAMGALGRPYIPKSRMMIDGEQATTKYNALGLTRAARALRIDYRGRTYTYRYLRGISFSVRLERPGLRITIADGRQDPGKRPVRTVTVHGETDETDLAIAILMEDVGTVHLSPGQAAFDGLLRPRSYE